MTGYRRLVFGTLTGFFLVFAACGLWTCTRLPRQERVPLSHEQGLARLREFGRGHLSRPWTDRDPSDDEVVTYTLDIVRWLQTFEEDCEGTINQTTARLLRAQLLMHHANWNRPEGWSHAEALLQPIIDGSHHPVIEWQIAYAHWLRGRLSYCRAVAGQGPGKVDEQGVRAAVDLLVEDFPFLDKVGQVDDLGFGVIWGWREPMLYPWNPKWPPPILGADVRLALAAWLHYQQQRLEPDGISLFGYSEDAANLYRDVCARWPGSEEARRATGDLEYLKGMLEDERQWQAWLRNRGLVRGSLGPEKAEQEFHLLCQQRAREQGIKK